MSSTNSCSMLEEHLTKSLMTRLTTSHVLERAVEAVVSLYQLLDVPDQLIVLRLR